MTGRAIRTGRHGNSESLMATAQPTEGLTESYARWRSSRLGQITDALEQQLLFERLGSVAGETLLDVGCGDGALASELARRDAIVTGLDADPVMIAAARRRSEIEATRLRLIEGQAERLPFDDAALDSDHCRYIFRAARGDQQGETSARSIDYIP